MILSDLSCLPAISLITQRANTMVALALPGKQSNNFERNGLLLVVPVACPVERWSRVLPSRKSYMRALHP